jgi:hypothetical protein
MALEEQGAMQDFFDGVVSKGLLVHGKYSISVIATSLISTRAELDEGIPILDGVIEEFARDLKIETTISIAELHIVGIFLILSCTW